MIEGPRGIYQTEFDKLFDDLIFTVYGQNAKERFSALFCQDNVENLRIIKINGKIVSHVGTLIRDFIINDCKLKVGFVGAVCTHLKYRLQNFAWILFRDVINWLKKNGADILFVSGVRSLYLLNGCIDIGKYIKYVVPRNLEISDNNIVVHPYKSDDLVNWMYLYNLNSVRLQRSFEDFRRLTRLVFRNRNKLFYSIFKSNIISSYLVLTKVNTNVLLIEEYGGSRLDVLVAVSKIYRKFPNIIIEVVIPDNDFELKNLLNSFGAKIFYTRIQNSILVLNIESLYRKLIPLFEAKIGSKVTQRLTIEKRDCSFYISLCNYEVKINNSEQLTKLIFDSKDFFQGNDNYDRRQIFKVIDKIFPLPRPYQGIDFI